MPERIEWELVPRVRIDKRREVEALAEEILALDTLLQLAPSRLSVAQQEQLVDFQSRMAGCVTSPCEAAEAPLLGSRPGWDYDARDAFGELGRPPELSIDEFTELIGKQHDCTLCNGAASHPGVSGIPCEFDLTPMAAVVSDERLGEQVQFELEPEEMLMLADDLHHVLVCRTFSDGEETDAVSYLEDAIRYLRFWAGLGFGVAPAYVKAASDWNSDSE